MKDWIAEDDSNRKYFEQFKLIWDTSKQLAATSAMDENKAWQRFQNRIRHPESKVVPLKNRKLLWTRIAASVILVAGIGLLAYFMADKPLKEQEVFAEAAPLTDTLPDGSIVTLNKRSFVYYKEKQGGDNRTVRLKGEAFFNVKPNKRKPFIIQVNKIEVTVIGTSFNVKADPDGLTEVVVETGIVRVASPDTTIELRAGERTTISDNNGVVVKQEVKDKLYNYYRTKVFVCDDTPLWKLVAVLNEAYDANIVFGNNKLKDDRLTTTFNNESLDSILEIIRTTFNISVTKTGDLIILK